jgi:hypothetical protein
MFNLTDVYRTGTLYAVRILFSELAKIFPEHAVYTVVYSYCNWLRILAKIGLGRVKRIQTQLKLGYCELAYEP